MIEKLTKEQEALMLQTRDEWINLFFNNVKEQKGIDKEKFEKGINWLYTDLLGKPMPKIVYCDSWESCLTDIDLLRSQDDTGESITDSVSDSILEPARTLVLDSVSNSVWNSALNSVWGSVGISVWEPVSDLNIEYPSCLEVSNYGWVSFFAFFEKIGVIQDDKFTRYKEFIKSGVFVTYPYEDIVFAVQPPIAIERDDQGDLHSTEKEAILFKDGTKYFFIHGVPFSEEEFKMQSKNTK